MIHIITEKRYVKESYNLPCEGIFWFIDNKLISYMDPVGFNTTLDHKKVWQTIRLQHDDVSFDYYPRGRVIVNKCEDYLGTTIGYKAYIYIDNCINNEEIIDIVKHQFNLGKCQIVYIGSDGGITSNHYRCNNCK